MLENRTKSLRAWKLEGQKGLKKEDNWEQGITGGFDLSESGREKGGGSTAGIGTEGEVQLEWWQQDRVSQTKETRYFARNGPSWRGSEKSDITQRPDKGVRLVKIVLEVETGRAKDIGSPTRRIGEHRLGLLLEGGEPGALKKGGPEWWGEEKGYFRMMSSINSRAS